MMPKFLLKFPTANEETVNSVHLGAVSLALNLRTTSATIRTPDTELPDTRKILSHPSPLESMLILVDSNIVVDRVEEHSHYSRETVERLRAPTGSSSANITISIADSSNKDSVSSGSTNNPPTPLAPEAEVISTSEHSPKISDLLKADRPCRLLNKSPSWHHEQH